MPPELCLLPFLMEFIELYFLLTFKKGKTHRTYLRKWLHGTDKDVLSSLAKEIEERWTAS